MSSDSHDPTVADEAQEIGRQLRLLRDRLQKNPRLAKLVPFSVQQRGQRDRDRLKKLFDYDGPDKETLRLLRVSQNQWQNNPSSFEHSPAREIPATNDPYVHLASRFLQIKHDDS